MFTPITRAKKQLFRGMVVDTTPHLIRYCTAPFMASVPIIIGTPVTVDDSISSPDKPMLKPLTSLADKIAGISTYNPQIVYEFDENGNLVYPKNSRVSVLEMGDIVMYSETPVNFNDLVSMRIAGEDPANNLFIGNISNSLPSPNGRQLPNSRFVEMTTSPGLAIIHIGLIST